MEDRELRILAIDDDAGDAELLRRHLGSIDRLKSDVIHATDAHRGLAWLEEDDVDVIFLDVQLGGDTGLNVVERIRNRGDLRPVIVLTGRGDEYVAAELTRAGADDYLAKSDLGPESLRRSLELALARYRQRKAEAELARTRERVVKHIAESNIELSQASRLDPLTRLMNRAAWDEAATIEHDRSSRYGEL
ncbi:MAG: response regulator [Phycisphaerae bacterium]|jgi:DNA-binding response OmpR family regulator